MQIRLYRSVTESSGYAVQPPNIPNITVVCLERDSDPDSKNHTGFDYWGAYSENTDSLDAWEIDNIGVLEQIDHSTLPDPVTFYPSPFADIS